jgi:tetratricopeptide (TPR) repeat protein
VLAEAGGVREAEARYDEWVRGVPEDELGFLEADGRREFEARLASARGDLDESIRLWGVYERECPGSCAVVASQALARIHERQGDEEAAIAEYERYLADKFFRRWWADPAYRAAALESLGRLYDARANAANAAKYYGMFVDLWENADEALQPRVAAARARLAELGASQ